MNLSIGMQIFHRGVPVELIRKLGELKGTQLWWVRPLFVKEPDREEMFEPHDVCSPIHSKGRSAVWQT